MRLFSTFLLAVLACTTIAQAQGDSPVLRPLAPVRIQEDDTSFVSKPTRLVLGAAGRAYLLEARESRVTQLSAAGRIERTFGRMGSGPGEFRSPVSAALSGDSLLAVYDMANQRLTLIDVTRWEVRRELPISVPWMPAMRFNGSDLLLTAWDFTTGTSTARVNLSTGALVERQGAIPDLGAQTQTLILGAFWNSVFTVSGDQVFAMPEVVNGLQVWSRGTRTVREVALPTRTRRGVSSSFLEGLQRDPANVTLAMLYNRSVPAAVAAVSADVVAVVTYDIQVDGNEGSSTHHVSLYDHRRNRACLDLVVPATRTKVSLMDPPSMVALRGDTLALLELTEDASYVLRRYVVNPERCDWMALR